MGKGTFRVRVGGADEGAEATWAYDLDGRIVTVIDGNGNRAELRYDGHGRQDRWTFPSTTRPGAFNDATPATALATAGAVNANDYEGYGYDANGNRTNLRKRDGRNIAFAYDALNRVTSKTYPQGGATPVFYGYDLRGLQLSARFNSQSGEGLTNLYDGFGRIVSAGTNQGGTTRTLTHQYDRNGNRIRITHPDSGYFTYAYDGLNRLAELRQSASTVLASLTYTAQGNPDAAARGGAATDLTHDDVGRLTLISHNLSGTAHDVDWSYGHNPASQVRQTVRSNDAYAWTAHYAVNRNYAANGLN